jgi:hypothetical protein
MTVGATLSQILMQENVLTRCRKQSGLFSISQDIYAASVQLMRTIGNWRGRVGTVGEVVWLHMPRGGVNVTSKLSYRVGSRRCIVEEVSMLRREIRHEPGRRVIVKKNLMTRMR